MTVSPVPGVHDEADAQAWLRHTLGCDDAAMARLDQLSTLLRAANTTQNLIARSTVDQLWQRHIVDSAQLLACADTLPDGGWLDLGSGAGFPGLVVAAIQPERAVTLVDSRRLRCEWLEHAATVLRLAHVQIRHMRVEDLPTAPFAVISARAFAPLQRLLSLSARFSTPETLWLLPKGAKAGEELAMVDSAWQHTFHVKQSLTDPAAGVIVGTMLQAPSTTAQGQPATMRIRRVAGRHRKGNRS